MQLLRRRAASAAPGTSWSTRGARPPPSSRTLHLQPVPGTDLALANGLLHIAIREGLVDEEYIAARTNGFDAVRRAVRAVLAGPGRADHRHRRRRPLRTSCRSLAAAPSAMILTARGAEQHADGTDTAQAWINLALALGLPGRRPRLGLGHDHRAGQRPGRARARAEGRPAARLPLARRRRRPRARRRGVGRRPRRAARAGRARPTRCSTGWAPTAACARCWSARPTRWCRAPNAAPRRGAARARWTSSCVSDIFLSETAQLADVVLPTTQWAEEERHDDQPRGAGAAPPQGALAPPAGGAHRPADLARAGRPARQRAVLLRRAARRSSTSCAGPARAASPTTRASPTSASTRSEEHVLAVPRPRTTPAPRACSLDCFPTPDGRARFLAVRTAGRRRAARRGLPVPAHHRPARCAVPVGHPDPAQPDARRGRARARTSRCTRSWPARSASPTATWCACPPAVARPCSAPASTDRHPAATRCSSRSTGAARRASTRWSPTRAGPDVADAGVQDVRRRLAKAVPTTNGAR